MKYIVLLIKLLLSLFSTNQFSANIYSSHFNFLNLCYGIFYP